MQTLGKKQEPLDRGSVWPGLGATRCYQFTWLRDLRMTVLMIWVIARCL
jgi:hypothetical protein